VNFDPAVRVSFEQACCIALCEKIQGQGHHLHLTKQFSLNSKGKELKVGNLEFVVSEKSIVVTTNIPIHGEEWFKGMKLDLVHFKYFLKPQYKEGYESMVPWSYLLDH